MKTIDGECGRAGTARTWRRTSLLAAILMAYGGLATAADTGAWVNTKTKAFLPPAPLATDAPTAARATLAAREQHAASMRQGEPVHVVLSLNLRNEAELDQLLQELYRPGSANYGRFLTPAEFRDRFGATEEQAAAVVRHLRGAGFVNVQVSPNRQLVSADGTGATVQAAFRTELKRFVFEGRQVYANAEAAQVPAELGGIVGAVLGLQNVAIAKTHLRRGPLVAADPAQSDRRAEAGAGQASPHNPVEFSALYDGLRTPSAGNTTVGIIAEGDVTQTLDDLGAFSRRNGLAQVATKVVHTGPANGRYTGTDGVGEWNLDSQSIVGAAGGAVRQLVFYVSPSMEFAAITSSYNRAVMDNQAKVINVSLGGCESDTQSTGTQAADDQIFKQALTQGQTFSVSTGDAGTYNCSVSQVSGQPGVPNGKNYDVSEPASSPYVIAVGGTTLFTRGKAYAGETVWNEGLAAIGEYGGGAYDATKRLWATGGGFSKFEAAPAWQRGVTGNARRGLPDVAFDAAQASGARIIINGQDNVIGGTSLAAPIFTGIWARMQSANDNRLKFPAASLYAYLSAPAGAGIARDVTSGDNGSGGYGYRAGRGWDATTGFGSLSIDRLYDFIRATPDFAR